MTTLYLVEPGTVARIENHTLQIQRKDQRRTCRLAEVDLILVSPGVQLTSVVISTLLDQGIETIFLTRRGQFRGRLQGKFPTNPTIRLAQYQVVDSTFGLAIAQQVVAGKIRNQRTLLQRRNRETQGRITELTEAIDLISAYSLSLPALETPSDRQSLMGIEGICARTYYAGLRHYFPAEWQFTGRNRQPPLDPINAMLSWGYGVLSARVFAASVQAGLDPYLGFFHATEPYRPNLVLDLMEEFRPVVVDQAVIAQVKANVLSPQEDFEPSPDGAGIWMGGLAKRLFIAQLEQQLQKSIKYPPQGRRLKISQILLEQCRSLARCLVDRQLSYQPFLLK